MAIRHHIKKGPKLESGVCRPVVDLTFASCHIRSILRFMYLQGAVYANLMQYFLTYALKNHHRLETQAINSEVMCYCSELVGLCMVTTNLM